MSKIIVYVAVEFENGTNAGGIRRFYGKKGQQSARIARNGGRQVPLDDSVTLNNGDVIGFIARVDGVSRVVPAATAVAEA